VKQRNAFYMLLMSLASVLLFLGINTTGASAKDSFGYQGFWYEAAGKQATAWGIDDSDGNEHTYPANIVIPEKVVDPDNGQTYTVTKVGKGAFQSGAYGTTKSVHLPDTVASIGESAFESDRLTSFTAPRNLKYVGEDAFESNKISSLKLNKKLVSISWGGFAFNKITTLNCPSTLRSIGTAAFVSNKLKTVKFNKGLKNISRYAFEGNKLHVHTLHIAKSTKVSKLAFDENYK